MHIDDIDPFTIAFRFSYRSLSFATKAAKRLKKAFEAEGDAVRPIPLGRAMALIAQMAGHRDWERLKTAIDPDIQDKIDQELSANEINRRRMLLALRLAKLAKIDTDMAERIVLNAEPTGSKAGLLRFDDAQAYFDLIELPIGATGFEAFAPVLERFPSIHQLGCCEWFKDHLEDDENAGMSIKVIPVKTHTRLLVSIDNNAVLAVRYSRHILANLLPFSLELENGAFGDNRHLQPLRPSKIDNLYVRFGIMDITPGDLMLEEASNDVSLSIKSDACNAKYPPELYEAVAWFILADMVLNTIACCKSLDVGIVSGSIDLDIFTRCSTMIELAEMIHFQHGMLMRSEWCDRQSLDEVVHLENFQITDD